MEKGDKDEDADGPLNKGGDSGDKNFFFSLNRTCLDMYIRREMVQDRCIL